MNMSSTSTTVRRMIAGTTLALAITTSIQAQPKLETQGGVTQLAVNGQPFLIRGAEVFNSTTSSREYMDPIWKRLSDCHVNTVLAPVSWEQFEPQEGTYDFTLVDGLIEDARKNEMRLVLLWFGSWKNLVSSYAPRWVRENPQRFPLVLNKAGQTVPTLSPFGKETLKADAKAFAVLMEHIKKNDADRQTVIMVQVQNEIGLATGERDHSAAAVQFFSSPVPQKLMAKLSTVGETLPAIIRHAWTSAGRKNAGTWTEVFGNTVVTDEMFMSWYFARYTGEVAASGKRAYPLPTFVNGALGRANGEAGSYPSGGPMPWFIDVWRAAAPDIDLLCPDIYKSNFQEWADRWTLPGNPLFVPEMIALPANAVLALGRNRALGVSPFGFEGRVVPGDEFSQTYALIKSIDSLILNRQRDGLIGSAAVSTETPTARLRVGEYTIDVRLRPATRGNPAPENGYVLILGDGPDTFVMLGRGVDVGFSLPDHPPQIVAIDRAEDGAYKSGKWVPSRRLNGDEIMISYDFKTIAEERRTGTGLRFSKQAPEIQRVSVFRTR